MNNSAPKLKLKQNSILTKTTVELANIEIEAQILHEYKQANNNSQILFQLFAWIEEQIPKLISNSKQLKSKKYMSSQSKEWILRRSYLWFHHIYSKKKKQNINQLANSWKLNGFCITGKPGIIVIEGNDSNIIQYTQTLKSWNWQRMIVRHSEIFQCKDISDYNERKCFQKWMFYDFQPKVKGGMKQLQNALMDVGLEEHFQMIANINAPMDYNQCSIQDNVNANCNRSMKNSLESNSKSLDFVTETKNGILIALHVTPNAKYSSVVIMNECEMRIRIKARAKDGEANAEICNFMASTILQCKKSNVDVCKGYKSRNKTISVQNMNIEQVVQRLLPFFTD